MFGIGLTDMPKSGGAVAPPTLPVPTALKSVPDRCHNYRHSLFNKPLTNTLWYFDNKIRILIMFFKSFFQNLNNNLKQYAKQEATRSAIFPKNLINKSISTFYLSYTLLCFSV